MSTVLHGRRKGQARGTPEMSFPQDVPSGMQLPDGTDLRQVTVLTKSDWERINAQLNRRKIEAERIRAIREERDSQRTKSKEIVKNWGNTIEGTRQRKLEARKIREQKDEEERMQMDIEEAKFQAQQRKEAIEKAKTQQYYQTDRVKNFHGALLLTEVLKEREAQLELKRLKEQASEDIDREYLENVRQAHELAILEDQDRAKKRLEAAHDTAQCLQTQIEEHLRDAEKQKQLDRDEGEMLQKLAIQNTMEKERLDGIRRDERRQMMLQNQKQIEDVQRMKQLQAQQEEEEDEECRVFAAAKRKMMRMRGEKEKVIHDEKQKKLDKIKEKLAAQMKQKKDDEDDRIVRALEETEAKRNKEEKEKEEKMLKMIAEAADHRMKQMKATEEQKKQARQAELEMLQVRRQADEIFRRNEEEKHARKYTEARELADFHLGQADERRKVGDEVRQQDLALAQANLDLLEMEEKQFQEYAQKVIKHCEEGGRNTYPLKKAAKSGIGGGDGPVFPGKGGIRPSYMVCDKSGVQMPHYQKGSTEETKEKIYGKGQTKKRLGFVW